MSLLDTTVADGVAVITLNDPERRNAISLTMVGDIQSTFDWLEADDDCRAVVITGAPPAFCAGADISHLMAATQASLRDIYTAFMRIADSPLPTIAAVNGAAVGAGVNMALVCDVILTGESARIDTGFVRIGLHPGGGHTWLMRNLIGPQATAATVLFGERMDGATAERVGFAWRCFPDAELLDGATAMAARAAKASPELLARVKASIGEAQTISTHEEAVDHELVKQIWSIGQPGFQERMTELQASLGKP